MNKISSIILTIVLALGIGMIFLSQPGDKQNSIGNQAVQNIEIKDGVQYVTVLARGGYSPKVSNAQANMPTKLIIKTNGTYDCSSSLVIKSIGYQKILSHTDEEIIDLGTPQKGTLQGLCSMGMYNFAINFN